MALDHAPQGIRSVAICPGYVRTDMLEHYYDNQANPDAVRASL
jgi:NAD(P)-dependent dehydrogenase (short-subunit alcohol dehydrogenase family)